MTVGSKSNEPKNLSKKYKNITQKNKKISQIISMEAKLKNFKEKPNKPYKK
jgi:sulfur transfer protein SufE